MPSRLAYRQSRATRIGALEAPFTLVSMTANPLSNKMYSHRAGKSERMTVPRLVVNERRAHLAITKRIGPWLVLEYDHIQQCLSLLGLYSNCLLFAFVFVFVSVYGEIKGLFSTPYKSY